MIYGISYKKFAVEHEKLKTCDFSTTEKYYMHATISIENRADAYERAINSKINNVFKRVQNI